MSTFDCVIVECDEPAEPGRLYCDDHRSSRSRKERLRWCSIEECDNYAERFSTFCAAHRDRVRRNGDPLRTVPIASRYNVPTTLCPNGGVICRFDLDKMRCVDCKIVFALDQPEPCRADAPS